MHFRGKCGQSRSKKTIEKKRNDKRAFPCTMEGAVGTSLKVKWNDKRVFPCTMEGAVGISLKVKGNEKRAFPWKVQVI